MSETTDNCQSCQYSRIEYLTTIDEDAPLIIGIDYQYRCKLSNFIVDYDYCCDEFELPF